MINLIKTKRIKRNESGFSFQLNKNEGLLFSLITGCNANKLVESQKLYKTEFKIIDEY